MTITELHQNFKIAADKVDSLNFPEFLPEEIDSLLNQSIENFIHQRLYGNNPRKEGFEETQKRFDDLLTLVNQQNYTVFFSGPSNKPNGVSVNYPTDYWHTIQEDVLIDYLDCNGQTQNKAASVIPVTHERYNKVIKDPFNKPNENKVLRMGLLGFPELIAAPNTTITTYNLRYIRKPAKVQFGSTYALTPPAPVDVQCDLPVHTHQEIINIARSLALGIIEKNTQEADKTIVTQE